MAAVAAEAAATAASPGEGGAGEAEPEMEPIPGSEAGTDPLPVTATEASVPDGGEADGQADEHRLPLAPPPPPPSSPGELARSPEAEKPPEPSLPASPAPQPEPRDEPPLSPPQPAAPPPPPASPQLIPGSEVRVTLDHIIEDALVVSFRLGDKLFSGVLMDLSKRFGPHGIPVTVFPKREYKEKPEAMPLQSTTFQEVNGAVPDTPPPAVPCPELSLPESLWPRKPPPLFHDGAPYPPPLFIRDTYNQAIPQPPPRRIKRPKRKMYREEPTSIMNAIKLRPRQVLCDKCKNSVVAEKKEIRKGSATDSAKYEDKKRRHESVATVNKKLRTEPKADTRGTTESHKRGAGSVVRVAGLPGRGRVVRVPAQATKKVLQSKNLEQAKARDVLKLAKDKAPRRQGEPAAAAPRAAHPKAHLTRRYQTPSSGALPPRVRLKPQRYRNEENDSSLKSRPAARSAGESPSAAGPGAQEDPACLPAQSDAAPGSFAFPPAAPTPREEKRQRRAGALNLKIFSKNVSKCVTPDGRTICVGDIVWAKIYGFPWWPGRILTITVSRRDNGLLARQEARISWFGSPTTSFLALSQLAPFLENFQARFNKKRKGLYRKAITEAARAAKQLTPEVRALLTQFET